MTNRWWIALVVIFAGLLGCSEEASGPDLVGASGTVTYKGSPLAGATVSMISAAGHLSNGYTDPAGKFTMTTGARSGVPVGKAKVGIVKVEAPAAPVDTTTMKPEDMQKMQMAGGGKATELITKSEIPEKYADPNKSGLVADVGGDPSKNVFTYDLAD